MTKPNRFLWAYNAERLRPDTVMTRARAAAMLRSWRSKRAEGYTVTRQRTALFVTYRVQVGALVARMALNQHPEA